MGEAIWCSINFRAPYRWADWISNHEPQYLGEADISSNEVTPDIFWWSYGLDGNYGLWDDDIVNFLDTLENAHIPYVATSEAKYEFEGERRIFDGERHRYGCQMGEHIVLTEGQWRDIQARRGSWESADEYFAIMSQNAGYLSIEHLQDFPPPDPDDALSFDEVEDAGLDGTLMDM